MDTPTISLVTTCKGRLRYLKESLPTWLRLDYPRYEIVVVDYDCPDGTAAWVDSQQDAVRGRKGTVQLRTARITDRPRFNLNDARNLGIGAAESEWVLMIDSDMHIQDPALLRWVAREILAGRDFVSNLQVLTSYYAEAREVYRYKIGITRFPALVLPVGTPVFGMSGTACISKRLWAACGGYDPEVNRAGYGYDDYEFYLRYLNPFVLEHAPSVAASAVSRESLDRMLARVAMFPDGAFSNVENGPDERHRFYRDRYTASSAVNAGFVKAFFRHAEGRVPDVPPADVLGDVHANDTTPAPVLAPWLKWWYPAWLGERLYRAGELNRARVYLAKALRHRRGMPAPELADVLLRLASLLAGRGCHSRARVLERHAWAVLRALPTPTDAQRYRLAVLTHAHGQGDEALELFDGLWNHPIHGVEASLRLGNLALSARQWWKARRFFTRWLRANPSHPGRADYLTGMWLGLGSASAGRPAQRAMWLRARRVLDSLPSPTTTQQYGRASIAQRLGYLDEARALFARLAEHPEHRAGAHFHLGEIALAEGNWLGAQRALRQCLQSSRAHGAGSALQVRVLRRLGEASPDPRSRRAWLLLALRAMRRLPMPDALQQYQRASLARQLGRRSEARALFTRLTNQSEHAAGAHYHLGEIALSDEQWREAYHHFQCALRLDPTHRAASRQCTMLSERFTHAA